MSEIDNAVLKDIQSLQKQKEDWVEVAAHVKDLITNWDHTKTDPVGVLSDINNFLDHAFCDMQSAKDDIKAYTFESL